jgi:hypothetical protein
MTDYDRGHSRGYEDATAGLPKGVFDEPDEFTDGYHEGYDDGRADRDELASCAQVLEAENARLRAIIRDRIMACELCDDEYVCRLCKPLRAAIGDNPLNAAQKAFKAGNLSCD